MNLPELFEQVVWYSFADQKREPNFALVRKSYGTGRCDLIVLKEDGSFHAMESVPHIDSPLLAANKETRKNYGGWEELISVRARLDDEHKKNVQAVEDTAKKELEREAQQDKMWGAIEDEIRDLRKKKRLNAVRIQQELQKKFGQTVSLTRINNVLNKEPALA